MRHFALVLLALPLAACIETHVVIDQTKPLEVNVNLGGRLDLVIHDARDDLEKITGEKPTNVVRPEDIGLPAKAGSAVTRDDAPMAFSARQDWVAVSLAYPSHVRVPREAFRTVALVDDLTNAMKGRSAAIRGLWDTKAVGESHSGLLVVKGTVTAEQQNVIDAENSDRKALYDAKAKEKKITSDEVALGYYIERLGYAKKGAWYEVRNKTTSQWEWKQWAG